jgi:hypothetical protein
VRVSLAAVLMIVSAGALPAQGAKRQQRPLGDSAPPARANLEQLVRQRMAQVTKQRLGASDDQMVKLQATNAKFDDKRRILLEQERDVRMALRDEMLRPDSARQGRVADLLDRLIKTQHQRVDIQEQEQQELSNYLTPLQRAKYFALEQQIRQRVTQLRQAQQGRGERLGRAGLPPGGRGVQPQPPPQ